MINFRNHYWIIGDDDTKVYSSALNTFVPVEDETYTEWLTVGNRPTKIANEAELTDVLKPLKILPEWIFNTPSFIQPAPNSYSQDQLTAYAADARWRKEQGGIITQGLSIATDDRSKMMIQGARMGAKDDPKFKTKWPGKHVLNAQQVIDISNAVIAHVNKCFAIFGEVETKIDKGLIKTLAQVDKAFE